MEMLGALTGLIGAGLSASNQAAQQNIEWANLIFQKQQAQKQNRFASAARTDAFGNKQGYDDILNEWVTTLTPTQKQIMQGTEKEQLQSVTEDADRNRRQRRRAEQTAIEAGKEYGQTLNNYRFDQPHSEDAIRDELEQLMLGGNQQRMKDEQGIVARQALRMGKGADMAKIIKATDDQLGQMSPDLILKARQAGIGERAQRLQQHDARYLPELKQWSDLMAQGGGDAQLQYSNVPSELQAMQGAQANAIQHAMDSEASNVGSAYKGVAAAAGKPIDLSSAAKAFSGLDKAGKSGSGAAGSTKYSLTAKAGKQGKTQNEDGTYNWWDDPTAQDIMNQSGDYSWLGSSDYLF